MSKEFYRHVGQRIRLRRSLLGISKAALGKAIGKSGSQVARYEKGEGSITAETLSEIGYQLQVPYFYFMEGMNEDVLYSAASRKYIAQAKEHDKC